jgi:hypothetical protein
MSMNSMVARSDRSGVTGHNARPHGDAQSVTYRERDTLCRVSRKGQQRTSRT